VKKLPDFYILTRLVTQPILHVIEKDKCINFYMCQHFYLLYCVYVHIVYECIMI